MRPSAAHSRPAAVAEYETQNQAVSGDPRPYRYASLDLWRGVACISVVLFHSTYYFGLEDKRHRWVEVANLVFAQLWLGVPLFFVISGFCIAASSDRARRSDQSPLSGLLGYLKRRWLRIFPPYWALLALSLLPIAALPWLFSDPIHPIPQPSDLSWLQWVGTLTLTESWRPAVGGGGEKFFMVHAWTLVYEEQFYILAALLVALFPNRLFGAFLGVSIAILAFQLVAPGLGVGGGGTLLDGYWWAFAAGIAVYFAVSRHSTRWVVVTSAGILSAMAILLVRSDFAAVSMYSVPKSLVFAFTFALVILWLHPWDAEVAGHWASAHWMWVGRMCYSVYLVHWPIVKAVSHGAHLAGIRDPLAVLTVVVPACAGLTLLCARVFHLRIERRFMSTATSVAESGLVAAPAPEKGSASG